MTLDKIIRIGTAKTHNGRAYSIFCHITYDGTRLSITGVEGPTSDGNALGACGQIDMHLRDHQADITPGRGWTRGMLARFFAVWERWHLNDMNAECTHQRQRGETWTTHPSADCHDCGHKLGHSWLHEPIPDDVLAFLAGLPDTDRTPAWV